MNRAGVAFAGNLIVDRIRRIDRLPRRSELSPILGIGQSVGGMCNSAIDMKRLDPALPVAAFGLAGQDAEGDYILSTLASHGIDTRGIRRAGETSFTDVYEERETNCRTMFHFGGANDRFDVDDVDYAALTQRIFHAAYPLLLKALDQPDAQYGSRMGRMLHLAREAGCLTSMDVISEDSNRYETLVRPALPHVDYLTVNELEASRITGVPLTDEHGRLIEENMPKALSRMFDLGVACRAIIHAPAAAFGMDADGSFAHEPGKQLPDGFIKGAVGAGDAFCAGALLAAYRSLSIADALRFGNAAAIQSLRADTSTGSMIPIEQALGAYDQLSKGGNL